MSALFLSHSHHDRAMALDLKGRLERLGYTSVFLSSDPEEGIVPGADWEKTLYARLRDADALIALCSPASVGSKWCFAEVTQARALNRPVFPVRTEPFDLPEPLQGLHAVDIDPDLDAAVTNLIRGLRAAGVPPGAGRMRAPRAVRRFALPLAFAAAALVALVAWHVTRRGYVTASSFPSAQLFLDGREIGTTPVSAHEVAPGEHELRLERARFQPFVRKFSVARGSTFEIERGLQAVDPGDPLALQEVAAAAGIALSDVSLDRGPGGGDAPAVVLFPRGRMREAPAKVRLWTHEGGPAYVVELETVRGGRSVPVWRGGLPSAVGKREIEIPAEARASVGPGTDFRVLVTLEGGSNPVAQSQGRVLSVGEQSRLRGALARLDRAYPGDDPTGEFLRVEVLLREGLFEEAYERTVALAEKVGPRKEVTRLALAVLDKAGMRGEGWWADWVDLHAKAE